MASSTVWQALLSALHPDSGSDVELLVLLLELLKKESSLVELFQAFPRKDCAVLWDLIAQRLHRLIEEEHYCTDHPSRASDGVLMDAFCSLAKCFVDQKLAKNHCPKALIGVAQLLHGAMFKLKPEESSKLQNKISQLCELWWKEDLPDKSTLVPQTISYLLLRSIEQTGTKSDITRVNHMREGLLLLDFDDESGDPLKHLLLRCLISPLYLRSAEGRKFLSFSFSLHLPFVDQLILTIKNQLPLSSVSIVEHYGEVLFRAWRLAQGQLLLKLEQGCLQHLIHCGIHVQDPKTAKAVRLVLHAFHENKKQKGVDEMLHRLYGPILWRCLHVANPIVRRNAAAVFIEAFPVQNPTEGVEHTEQLLQKQFQHLRELMDDGDEQVRTVGARGTCRVLGVYWELIPPATIKTLVDVLLERAFDGSSFGVRVAVVSGLAFVLENALTHDFLKLKLPSLQPLIYDSSPRVQIAFLDLLLLVKKLRSIRFVDTVSVEILLKRLEVCSPPVCVKITELLMSYFPQDKPLAEQVRRGWALLRKHPHNGKLFFNYVHKHAPVEAILNLLSGFHQFLLTAGKEAPATEPKKKSKGEPVSSVLWQKDQPSVEALLCTMAQLWHNVRKEAAQAKNSEAYTDLVTAFEEGVGDIQSLMACFPSELAGAAILAMATFLPTQSSTNLLPKLIKLPATASVSQYGPPIECLFSWGRALEVVGLVVAGLEQQAKAQIDTQTALKYLTYIAENQRTRAWLLLHYEDTKGPTAELRQFLARAPSRALEGGGSALLELFGKLQIHLYARTPSTPPAGLLSLLDLMGPLSATLSGESTETEPAQKRKKKATPNTNSGSGSSSEKEQLVVCLAKLCSELVTLGLPATQFTARVSAWVSVLKERRTKGPLGLLCVLPKLAAQLLLVDMDACFTFTAPVLSLFSSALLEQQAELESILRSSLTEMLRTHKDKKSNLIRTVGFFVAFLLTEREGDALQAVEQMIVSTLIRLPAAMFSLPQVLERLAPPSEPVEALSAWVDRVREQLAEFGQGVKNQASTLKGRADFMQCLRVCVATLNLLQSDTADLQRGCLAAAAQQRIVKRTPSPTLMEDAGFMDEISEILKECVQPAT